jgi:hypothetical protein
MADYRAIAWDQTLRIDTEIADTDTLNVGNIAPLSGPLTISGSLGSTVNIDSNFYATGFDLGDATHRAGTLYADTINANSIVGPINTNGTNANVWAVNQDAVAAVAENVGVMWEATDGLTTLHNWRQLTAVGGRDFRLQHKANPTDPKDLSESGYLEILSINSSTNTTYLSGHLQVQNGVELTSGFLHIPPTSSPATGIIQFGGNPFLHSFGNNTYLGMHAGVFTTSSSNLVGIGRDTFSSLTGITSRSVAVGDYALAVTTASSFNVAVGHEALTANLTGNGNTAVGYQTGSSLTTGSNNVFVGYQAGQNELGSNKLYISNSNTATPLIGGDFSTPQLDITGNFTVTGSLVDLQTGVTTLDVPDGTGFSIGGTSLTTANWTAPNVDTLLDGSNADPLHEHEEVGTVHIYPPAAVNPAGTPNDGDMYFNTNTESWQYYDASRTKWLSTSEFVLNFGEDGANGNLLAGYGISNAATGTGVVVPRDATIKRITARAQGGNATKAFDILVNGVTASSFSLAAFNYKNNAADIDLSEDDYIWVEASAIGASATDVAIVLWVAWRT